MLIGLESTEGGECELMPEGEDDLDLEGDCDDVVELVEVGECKLFGLICLVGRREFVERNEVSGEEYYIIGGRVGMFLLVILRGSEGGELEALRLLPRAMVGCEGGCCGNVEAWHHGSLVQKVFPSLAQFL